MLHIVSSMAVSCQMFGSWKNSGSQHVHKGTKDIIVLVRFHATFLLHSLKMSNYFNLDSVLFLQ